jgi:hypothetical protein
MTRAPIQTSGPPRLPSTMQPKDPAKPLCLLRD